MNFTPAGTLSKGGPCSVNCRRAPPIIISYAVLGAVTLGTLGLMLNPPSRDLFPMRLLLSGAGSA